MAPGNRLTGAPGEDAGTPGRRFALGMSFARPPRAKLSRETPSEIVLGELATPPYAFPEGRRKVSPAGQRKWSLLTRSG